MDNNKLDKTMADLVPTPKQMVLGLYKVEKQVEKDGIEMGVLENGIPFLSESGLARMCGVDRKVINRLAVGWKDERTKPRGTKIASILASVGYNEEELFLRSTFNNIQINAYTEPVCMALLEYYAFESEPPKFQAQNAFRILAKTKFREFIYQSVGYSPEQKILDSWRHFHDRVSLVDSSVPFAYFCVFREVASIIIPMINSGVAISDKVIPDISIGMAWAKHWNESELSKKYGDRIKYNHNYPNYYPQALSNPQPAWAYPDTALPEFRRWLTETYITQKYPKYLIEQAKQGKLDQQTLNSAIEAFSPQQIS